MLTCACRILQYIVLLCNYFIRKTQHTEQFVIFDMVSDTLMLTIGCVMVLFNVSLTHGVQIMTNKRTKAPSIAKMLVFSCALAIISPITLMVVELNLTYYSIAALDFVIAMALYYSLYKMFRAMAHITILQEFEGKTMAKLFVNAFGISFLSSAILNFAKSFWW